MTLNERIQNIRLTLQKPFHFFALIPGKSIKSSLRALILEDEAGNCFTFQGRYIVEAIENAEKYIEGEKKMGSLRDKSKDEEDAKAAEEAEQNNEKETQPEKDSDKQNNEEEKASQDKPASEEASEKEKE